MSRDGEYVCKGTTDPKLVRQGFNHLLPVWQEIDLPETNRLEDARERIGPCFSDAEFIERTNTMWFSITGQRHAEKHTLAAAILTPHEFLPVLRNVEGMLNERFPASVVAYCSNSSAARILPGGMVYRELIRSTTCTSVFSADRNPPDWWAFLVESHGLCLLLWGQEEFRAEGSSSSFEPRFLDQGPPKQGAGMLRKPYPGSDNTSVALPEPEPDSEQ